MPVFKVVGFGFALVGFGAGFSTFNCLMRASVGYLEIDGTFIREIRYIAVNL